MLVRVLEIPKSSGRFHFDGGEGQTFIEVDWFRDDRSPGDDRPDYSTTDGRQRIEEFIRAKRYFSEKKAYLVLHPVHPFTIGYSAP
jgi:hypothetical protein